MPWAAVGLPWGHLLAVHMPLPPKTVWPPNIPLSPPLPSGAYAVMGIDEPKPAAPPAPRYYGPLVCDFKAIAKRRKELGL